MVHHGHGFGRSSRLIVFPVLPGGALPACGELSRRERGVIVFQCIIGRHFVQIFGHFVFVSVVFPALRFQGRHFVKICENRLVSAILQGRHFGFRSFCLFPVRRSGHFVRAFTVVLVRLVQGRHFGFHSFRAFHGGSDLGRGRVLAWFSRQVRFLADHVPYDGLVVSPDRFAGLRVNGAEVLLSGFDQSEVEKLVDAALHGLLAQPACSSDGAYRRPCGRPVVVTGFECEI